MSDSARLEDAVHRVGEAANEFEKDVSAHWPHGRKDGRPDFIAKWVKCFKQLASELVDDAKPFTD